MIHDASTLDVPARIRADLCVVGSGPGGAAAATMAAEAGLKVVLIEAGGLVAPTQMTQREADMLPRLLWNAGNRTTADRAVRIVQGHGVGGSSVHNINLCKRIPETILSRWAEDRRLDKLGLDDWDALYDEVEEMLGVAPIERDRWNRHNRLLEKGCEALGWEGRGLSHNRTGCIGSGYCEVGCAYDAKNNALKVLMPRFVKAGGTVITHCQAVRVEHDGGAVRGVRAVALDGETFRPRGEIGVLAARVCVAASATGTAALLRRSKVPDPSEQTGRTLRIHPALLVAGDFPEPVRAWDGIPQTYECTEWLDFDAHAKDRTWIITAFGHPVAASTMLPGHGEAHRDIITRYDHLGVFTAMLHEHTTGEVAPDGELGMKLDYWPSSEDRRELMRGAARCAQLLIAAGATRVVLPSFPARVLGRGDDPRQLAELPLRKGELDVSGVHPMSTVPMSDDPALGPVDSAGKHHHVEGLWVADGSLFPESIGVPPQISIYALGLHVGRALAQAS